MTTAYAIAHLRTPVLVPEVLEYLERIQATLDPYEGRFLVHGAEVEVREDEWPGTIVIIEFPSLEAARGWYGSPAYQAILPLRTNNIDGAAVLVPGVGPDYDPAALARRVAAGGGAGASDGGRG
jgi:uncharacterized protein (DUF1330 family)